MTPGAPPPGRLLLFALSAITVLALLLRIPATAQPLGIDQGLQASAAHQMSHGQLLYRDVWDHKPPGSILMYLTAFSLFGWTAVSVALFDILAATAATFLIFTIARRLAGTLAGAVAAAVFATMTMPNWLYGHSGFLERSVAETYIAVLVSLAAWSAIRLRERPSIRFAVLMGLSGGAAVVFKPNAGIYLPAFALWLLVYADRPWQQTFRGLVVAAAASFVPLLVMFGWLWSIGVMADARVALLDFNRAYVSQGFTASGVALAFSKAVFYRMKTEPLWTAGALGAVVVAWQIVRFRKVEAMPALAVVWGGGAAIAIVANGAWLFNSYFIPAQPALAIMAAWLVTARPRRDIVHRAAAVLLIGISVVLLVQRNYVARVYVYTRADVQQLLGRGDRISYLERFGGYANNRGYSARANDELTGYLRQRTVPGDRLYFFGINCSAIYFATDRLMANRFLRVNVFVPSTFPHPGFSLADVVAELESKRPAYLVFEELHNPSVMGVAVDHLQEDADVLRLLQAYSLETRIEDFSVYRLADRAELSRGH
jgi:4-amino-4-deoxy-L-arabinose transferase-like glycosyltransferase